MTDMVSVPAEKIAALRETVQKWEVTESGKRAYRMADAAHAVVDAVETEDEIPLLDDDRHPDDTPMSGEAAVQYAPSPARDDAEKAWRLTKDQRSEIGHAVQEGDTAGLCVYIESIIAAHMAAAEERVAVFAKKAKDFEQEFLLADRQHTERCDELTALRDRVAELGDA